MADLDELYRQEKMARQLMEIARTVDESRRLGAQWRKLVKQIKAHPDYPPAPAS